MKETCQIAVAQVGFLGEDLDEHVSDLKRVISEHADADLLVFPELILQGHPSMDRPAGFLFRRSRALYGPVSRDIHTFIRERRARVILGEIRRRKERLSNIASYIDSNGSQHYTKTHVHWTEQFVRGRRLRTFDTPLGKVGINICFDAAFPEVWRVLALRGAEIMVNISAVPSDFPTAYMHRRMRGAALDNQAFVIYANRPAPQFAGGSGVFGPRGERIAAAEEAPGVVRAEIDLVDLRAWRAEEQIFPNRRPGLYKALDNAALPSQARRATAETGKAVAR
ncbi:MAG: carbon-nitrogen hydrolase family protein [bacterium]